LSIAIVLALLGCGAGGASSDPTEKPAPASTEPPAAAPADDADDGEDPSVADPPDDPTVAPSTAPAALLPGCTAKANVAGHPAWFFFARPDKPCTGKAGSGLDSHAVDELVRLIASAPAGARIDGHIFSISVDSVAKALLDAEKRGVEVWLSTDGAVATSTDPAKTQYLDQLTHKVYCASANRTSCISTADKAISHTKLFTFSQATAPDGMAADDVVWFGSANQTYASGERLYNNTVQIYGDADLYGKLRAYLDDLYAQRTQSDYYDPTSGRGHLLTTSADVYVSPEQQTDLVVNRLDDITPGPGCEVRVIQASIRDSRLPVVQSLVALKNGGCSVRVVAATVEPLALGLLKGADIDVRKKPIHDKSFVVHASFAGVDQFRVYTGSHNLSGGSAHSYDEIFVKLAPETDAAHPIYDAYTQHFGDAFDDAPAY
jgi:phosphatidylserine/phosphatidylglycerophosphate/cardiolipin synthase-like enzyme